MLRLANILWSLVALSLISTDGLGQAVSCDAIREPIFNYPDGFRIAIAERRPMLIIVTQKVCPPCVSAKRLLAEMRQANELGQCVLVEIEASTETAQALMVGKRRTPQLLLLDMRHVQDGGVIEKQSLEVVIRPKIIELIRKLRVR